MVDHTSGGSWRHSVLRAFSFGAGAVLALAAIVGLGIYVASMPSAPRQWNKSAVVASYVELSLFTGDNPQIAFSYALQNTTDHDYQLPDDPKAIFVVRPDGSGLQPDRITWASSLSVPAKQRVVVKFIVQRDYSELYPKEDKDNTEKIAPFMDRRLNEIDGFRILDTQNRYQVDLPRGWNPKVRSERLVRQPK